MRRLRSITAVVLFWFASCAALVPTLRSASADRPNILLIIFTAWGGHTHAGAYGNAWIRTPNFDRVAREGILFSNAFTASPKAGPCRATLLTGRNPWQLEQAISHGGYFPSGYEVYPDLLERAGYHVGMTGMGSNTGDYKTLAKRTRDPAGPAYDEKTLVPPATGIFRNDYAGNFAEFLRQKKDGQPFCFWIGFREAHREFELGAGVRMGKRIQDVKVPAFLPDLEIVRSDLLDYAVEIEWGDTQVGEALRVLEQAGELENTVVIVTSDRGMAFPFVKDQVHEDGFHMPMAIRWGKEIKAGRVVDDFINMRDFAPTFLELAGLPVHPQMTGRSLSRILRSNQSGWIENRATMLIGKEGDSMGRPFNRGYPVRAIRTKEYLYVRNFFPDRFPVETTEVDVDRVDPAVTFEVIKQLGGHYFDLAFGKRLPEELYRISDDPECVRNLAHDLAFTSVRKELRNRMVALLTEEKDPRVLGNGHIFDNYPYLARGPSDRPRTYDAWIKSRETEITQTLERAK